MAARALHLLAAVTRRIPCPPCEPHDVSPLRCRMGYRALLSCAPACVQSSLRPAGRPNAENRPNRARLHELSLLWTRSLAGCASNTEVGVWLPPWTRIPQANDGVFHF